MSAPLEIGRLGPLPAALLTWDIELSAAIYTPGSAKNSRTWIGLKVVLDSTSSGLELEHFPRPSTSPRSHCGASFTVAYAARPPIPKILATFRYSKAPKTLLQSLEYSARERVASVPSD